MTYKSEALEILESAGDIPAASKLIYPNRALALFVLEYGLGVLKSRSRRQRRRELTAVVQPQFMRKPGGITGQVVLTPAAKKRLTENTRDLFGADGWMIGDLNLGSFTKEQLLAQASNERASAKGSLRNAQFYEALADPLQPGQRARDYWKPGDAQKIKRTIWQDTEGQRPTLS